jgi:hypothetical protein
MFDFDDFGKLPRLGNLHNTSSKDCLDASKPQQNYEAELCASPSDVTVSQMAV